MASKLNQAVSNTSQHQEDISISRLIQQYSDLELAYRMQLEEIALIELAVSRSDLQQGEATSETGSGQDSGNDAFSTSPHLSHGEDRRPESDRFSDQSFDDIERSYDHQKASIGLDDSWQSKYGHEDFRPRVPRLVDEKLPQMSGSNFHEPDSWRPPQPRVDSLHQDDNFPFEADLEEFTANFFGVRTHPCQKEEFTAASQAKAISTHDEKFARFLSSFPESEWEAVGCQLNELFPSRADDAASSYTFKGKSPLFHEPASMQSFSDSFAYEEVEQAPCETCKICLDAEITLDNSYCVNDICNHRFCSNCLRQYAESVIIWSDRWEIPCPGIDCMEALSMGICEILLPVHMMDQLAERQVEQTPRETCKICLDAEITLDNSYCVNDICNHRFCSNCLRQHAESVIKSSDRWEIPCPEMDCMEVLSMGICEILLPVHMMDQLVERQVEHLISDWERVYCPYENCSYLQLRPELPEVSNEPSSSQNGGIGPVECLSCHRLFCLECQVPWHPNLTCEESERLTEDEKSDLLLLRGLARENNWQRCACGHLVERNEGCNHMRCRCGKEFCYICAGTWSHDHICPDHVS